MVLRVWLCDFGMARSVARRASKKVQANVTTDVTPMTAHVCTSWYRAPELLVATVTPGELDARHRPCVMFEYGMSLVVRGGGIRDGRGQAS